MNIGEKIRILRQSNNKSQEELANDLGVSRQTINKWETDKAQPSIDNVKLLCEIFDVSADYMLETGFVESGEQAVATPVATPKAHKSTALIIGAVADGILFLISTLWTVVFGFVAFSPNKGYDSVATDNIDTSEFAVMLVLSVILLVIEILLVVQIIKNRKKSTQVDTNVN